MIEQFKEMCNQALASNNEMEFLSINKLEWHKENILIIKPKHVANDIKNRKEAELMEKYF